MAYVASEPRLPACPACPSVNKLSLSMSASAGLQILVCMRSSPTSSAVRSLGRWKAHVCVVRMLSQDGQNAKSGGAVGTLSRLDGLRKREMSQLARSAKLHPRIYLFIVSATLFSSPGTCSIVQENAGK